MIGVGSDRSVLEKKWNRAQNRTSRSGSVRSFSHIETDCSSNCSLSIRVCQAFDPKTSCFFFYKTGTSKCNNITNSNSSGFTHKNSNVVHVTYITANTSQIPNRQISK